LLSDNINNKTSSVVNNCDIDSIKAHIDVLEAVAANTETCLVYLDRDFNFIWVNDAYARVCARGRDEFYGHNHFEFYPHEENEAIFKRVRDTGEPFKIDAKPFIFPDHLEWGTTYWDWTLSPVKDAAGKVQGLVFSLLDVTARRKVEDELRWYHTIASRTADIFLIVKPGGQIIEVNEAAVREYGYSRDELLNMNISDLRSEDELPIVLQQLEHAADGLLFETVHKRRNGTTFPVEVNARGITIGDETVIASIIRDISERRAAEDILRDSEERVRRKLNSILTPEAGIGQLELADILDVEAIQAIMDSFYKLAPIPMAIIDLKGRVLVGIGWQDICTKFHRINPETCAHCIESDTLLTIDVPPGEFRLYKCKNNMWDIATPIMVGGEHVGNLFSGQFFFDDETVDYAFFSRQAAKYGFDADEYISALQRVPRLSRQTVNDAMTFFVQLADMLSKLSYGNIKLARLLAERDALMSSLSKSEERYRTLFTSMSEGFVLYELIYDGSDKPTDYRFIEANSAFERQTGLAREDIIGRTIREILPDIEPFWLDTYAMAASTGEPVRFEQHSKRNDRYYEAVVFQPSSGKLAAFFLDITDRKNMENELELAREESERSAAQLLSMISSMTDGVSLADSEGKIVFMNEAGMRIMGVPPDEALENWLYKHERYTLNGDMLPVEQTATLRALRGEIVRDVHYRLALPWGKEIVVGFSASPVRNAEGEIIGATTVFHDETEKVEFEQRKEELFKREHRIAQTLQNALIPPELPKELMGCKIASIYEPASDEAEVGGDFYDVFELENDRIAVLIGDIAGKGLHAAIGVASARYAIRAYAYSNPNPADVLYLANNALCRVQLEGIGMLTAFYAVIDPNDHTITYASAGHEPPVISRADGTVEELVAVGLPLAIIRDFGYEQSTRELYADDIIVAMTDGITEARRSSTELFGKDRVLDYLRGKSNLEVDDVATGLISAAKAHTGGRLQDDTAVLALKPMRLNVNDEPSGQPIYSSNDLSAFLAAGCDSLTRNAAQDFLERLEAIRALQSSIRIDLHRVKFIDTSVLSALADTATSMLKLGKRLQVLVAEASYPLHVLKLIHFDEIIDIEVAPASSPEIDWTLLEEQTLELSNRTSDLNHCRQAAFNAAMTLGFSRIESWNITAAFVEACANAIEHGNKGIDKPVSVTVRALPDRFEAIIRDHGEGFICPDKSPIPPPSSTRGRGIPLMKLYMDEVAYKTENGCEVTLIKYLPGNKPGAV